VTPASREVVESFWAAMQENDWARAADQLADGCVIDWPCSGEPGAPNQNVSSVCGCNAVGMSMLV